MVSFASRIVKQRRPRLTSQSVGHLNLSGRKLRRRDNRLRAKNGLWQVKWKNIKSSNRFPVCFIYFYFLKRDNIMFLEGIMRKITLSNGKTVEVECLSSALTSGKIEPMVV